jgi:hypothetical protein
MGAAEDSAYAEPQGQITQSLGHLGEMVKKP